MQAQCMQQLGQRRQLGPPGRGKSRAIVVCTRALLTRPSAPTSPPKPLPQHQQPVHQQPVQPGPVHQQPQHHAQPQHQAPQANNILVMPPLLRQSLVPMSVPSSSGPPSVPEPAVQQDTVWHFAYGANMSFYTLQRRDVRVLSRDAAMVADKDVKLVFSHRGGYSSLARLQPGQAPKYQPYAGSHVHGVLYKINKDDFNKLVKREGGYVTQEFRVQTYEGKEVMALAFVSSPMAQLAQEVAPTERYMALLREGAADNYLHPLYQAWLSSIDTIPSAGLPAEYFNTPAKYVGYGFLLVTVLIGAGYFLQ